jgi:predicted RNA binding protein YcfA (HicA-like mRNA interferase family)
VDSRSIIKALEADRWVLKRVTGSHHHYTHLSKPGLTTVPHPKKDLPVGTVKAIERQSGISLLR